jgi:hypothetical protein
MKILSFIAILLSNFNQPTSSFNIPKIIGKQVVETFSSALPNFDSVGHHVLHANNLLIGRIIHVDFLSDELKKDIILKSIHFSQQGDNMGSHILQFYYDVVEKCL